MSTTTARVYNFSSGPAVLPVSVLEQIQRDLVALPGVGMSILEVSHRSAIFEQVIAKAEADLRELAGIPANYKVLFLQGGASLQFSMVPLNLLTEGRAADYIITGTWTDKAAKEAKKVGTVNIAATSAADNFSRIPAAAEWKLTPDAAYVHITSNNTIEGTQWHAGARCRQRPARQRRLVGHLEPADRRHEVRADLRRRAEEPRSGGRDDRDHPRRPAAALVEVAAHDAQLRDSRRERLALQHAAGVRHLRRRTGAAVAAGDKAVSTPSRRTNQRKAAKLYAEIDRTGFYRPTAKTADRSLMNVTFRLPSEALEKQFVKESTAAGFDGLKGHRSVGGMRASIYNAFPEEGIDSLVEFMREFERKNG